MKALLTFLMVVAFGGVLLTGCDRAPAPQLPAEPPTQTPVEQPPIEDGAALAPGAYPLTVCVVSGEPLGSMGDPVILTHEGQQVQICCAGCEDTFRADPEKFLAQVTAARNAAAARDN